MFLYCKSWDLEVNPVKTKITIFFSNRKPSDVPKFMYNRQEIDVDESFVYLGTMFSYNGRFIKNNQRLYNQARKAMFAVLSKFRKLHLPVDIQLQLFDSMVIPILLYGSEVTSFEKHDILDSYHCLSLSPSLSISLSLSLSLSQGFFMFCAEVLLFNSKVAFNCVEVSLGLL